MYNNLYTMTVLVAWINDCTEDMLVFVSELFAFSDVNYHSVTEINET